LNITGDKNKTNIEDAAKYNSTGSKMVSDATDMQATHKSF
jgi:hypothetical protein